MSARSPSQRYSSRREVISEDRGEDKGHRCSDRLQVLRNDRAVKKSRGCSDRRAEGTN